MGGGGVKQEAKSSVKAHCLILFLVANISALVNLYSRRRIWGPVEHLRWGLFVGVVRRCGVAPRFLPGGRAIGGM